MRLKNYINEEKSLNDWIPIIKKDCSKFIKDIHGSKGTLTRMASYLGGNDLKKAIIKKSTHSKRRPLDTNEKVSKIIDELFKEKFGWKARTENVVFCFGTPFSSNDINRGFLVFPVGNYNFLWSNVVYDLYNTDIGNYNLSPDHIKEIFKNRYLNTYIDKDLKKAVVSENEIMVHCKEYYLIRTELIERVDELLNLNWQGAKFTGRRL